MTCCSLDFIFIPVANGSAGLTRVTNPCNYFCTRFCVVHAELDGGVVEIHELRLLEFYYYVLQISVENATNDGTLQVICIHSGTAKTVAISKTRSCVALNFRMPG